VIWKAILVVESEELRVAQMASQVRLISDLGRFSLKPVCATVAIFPCHKTRKYGYMSTHLFS